MPEAITITGAAVACMPTASPSMMFVAWPDRDEQERHDQADDRRDVEIPEAELAAVERGRDGDEAERRQHRRDEHRAVERVHDVPAAPDAREPRPAHRRAGAVGA